MSSIPPSHFANLENSFAPAPPAPPVVTSNPFFGVRVQAPDIGSPAHFHGQETRPEFMNPLATSKDEQLFAPPTVTRLINIAKNALNLRFLDKVARALLEETEVVAARYINQIAMTGSQLAVSPQLFTFLKEYKDEMVRKLRTLASRPVESASQRAQLAPIIAFMTDSTETKGYGTLFPISTRKTSYHSDYRSSFRSNSGESSDSKFKPNRYRSDNGSGDQRGGDSRRDSNYSSGQSSRRDGYSSRSSSSSSYQRSPSKGGSYRSNPYERRGRN
jgi:hypothetical protein